MEIEEESINLREVLAQYIIHWKWIVLSLILAIGFAYAYLRYAVNIYESQATVLVKDDKKGGLTDELSIFSDLGVGGMNNNLFNEIEVLKSRTLISEVVEELKLYKQVFTVGQRTGLKSGEIYSKSPFSWEALEGDSVYFGRKFNLELLVLSENEINIKSEINNNSLTVSYGEPFNIDEAIFVIHKSPTYENSIVGREFILNWNTLTNTANNYRNKLNVQTLNKDASILSLSIQGPIIQKNNDFINTLIAKREEKSLMDKNEIARNTSNFINNRVKIISTELLEVESEGESFKSSKSLVDVSSDAQVLMQQESNISAELLAANIQLNLSNFVLEYLKSVTDNSTLLPSNLGIEESSIAQVITKYNELVLERNQLKEVTGNLNPRVKQLEERISSLRNSLDISLSNYHKSLQLKIDGLNKQLQKYESEIAKIPAYERMYREIRRQQEIKESLYLYLLQKREENEITMVASTSDTRIIDDAYSNGIPVSPKRAIIMLGALLLGIIVPIGVIYLVSLLDNKIKSRKDIEARNLPFLGDVPQADKNIKFLTKEHLRSSLAESLRMLRANLNFMLSDKKDGKGKTIMFTSTVSGEGKTFLSINLGFSLAQTDKKVVVVGMDLRAPKLGQYVDIPINTGVTNYIVNPDIDLDNIIQHSIDQENLDYIVSGPVPPNPSELLIKDRVSELIEKLRERYDYVIIDTAPVGLVVDTMLLVEHADLLLYVTRYNYLNKNMLQVAEDKYKSDKIKNMAVILNGVDFKKERYSYGYGYGYGYGNETKQKGIRGLFKK